MKKLSLLLLVAFLFAAAALPAYAAGITVGSQDVSLDFPKTMTFTLDASSTADIQAVTLVARFQDVTRRLKAKITPGTSVQAKIEWNLDTETSGNDGGYLPPGVTFDYSWIIEDAAGGKLETPSKSYTINDNRIQWDVAENDLLAIHWYGAPKAFGQEIFDSAVGMLPQLREELGAEPKTKVNVWLYSDREDFRTSMPNMNDWTGGRSFGEYSSILLLVSPFDQDEAVRGVRHELTHQVIYDSLGSGLSRTAFPHWMNEGMAVYHENQDHALVGFLREPLDTAIADKTLPRLKTLDGNFSPDSDEALLSYGVSYSIVDLLFKNYGEEKMNEAFALFKEGTLADKVFQTVYGTNTDGLDNLYRKSVGLPERAAQQNAGALTAVPTFSLSSAETPAPKGAATATTQSVSVANTPAPANATPAAQSGTSTNNGAGSTGLCGGILGGFALAMFGAYEWRKRRNPRRL